jgi:excisionase family DNA binding protein
MPSHTQEVAAQPAFPTTVVFGTSPIRFSIPEAASLLRMSRAQLYNRINDGAIKPQKDGARTYITRSELQRYVDSCR